MFILKNEKIYTEFSEKGAMTVLKNSGSNVNVIEIPDDNFFFINLGDENCKEILAYADMQTIRGECSGSTVTFYVDGLKADRGLTCETLDISLAFHISLKGDKLIYTADIDNRTDKYILDFEYPRIGKIKSLGSGFPSLLWPENVATVINNAGNVLADMPVDRENGSCEKKVTYPGFATMGMAGLLDFDNTLMVSVRDRDFYACEFKAKGYPKEKGCISLIIDKNICIRNESVTTAPIVLEFYKGDWHRAAKDYANWMNRQRPQHEKPEWAKNMLGFFLVINKQQFGYEMWDYDSVPKLYDIAKSYGFDVLSLFGWYQTGHDNNYPDLEVSSSLGGAEKLKTAISKVHDKGGKVTLYYQGHLIDTESDYYKKGPGKKVSCKTIWGTEYIEFYRKSHLSDFNAQYSRRVFATSCYSCRDWRKLMVKRMRWLASFGADGAIYDQIGGVTPYICFDPNHKHFRNNPALAITHGQRKLLAELQNESKAIDKNFTFMSEHITDTYSPYLDMVHGLWCEPSPQEQNVYKIGDEKGNFRMPEVFRYCFPDSVITVRNPNPFVGRRTASFAFTYGFPLEMEIRYRQDKIDLLKDKYCDLRAYSKAVSNLRKKYIDDLAYDKFTADVSIINRDCRIKAMGYKSDDKLTVAIWNDCGEKVVPDVKVRGKKLVYFETVDGKKSDHFVSMYGGTVAVAIFK